MGYRQQRRRDLKNGGILTDRGKHALRCVMPEENLSRVDGALRCTLEKDNA
jgi:hypothetical protein